MSSRKKQSIHFDRIYHLYLEHYGDSLTEKYRHEIFCKKIFLNLNLNNKKVLDLGCGSGQLSLYLKKIFPKINLIGIDISKNNLKRYPFKNSLLDIRKNYLKKKFDIVISFGLLHYVAYDLEKSINNISKMVKKNGLFIFVEPNSRYILNPIRKLWYKIDPLFDSDNEKAFSYDSILKLTNDFKEIKKFYFGFVGFFLINNSMIFRLNKKIKFILFKPLIILDKIFSILPPFFLASYVGILKKK